ncbi:hypothetical protein PVAG01_07373 [Phlyctema vagabunda]|uniref:Uncharacterized protein n=1 Tax=Phlyctema vagabunda TaxID=108571 RepID=A0ABR4PC87_9HELO
MGIQESWSRFSLRYARAINIAITTVLLLASLVCYPLYIILFFRPQWYHLESLLSPTRATGFLKPQVVVGLITALFAASTAALVTRAVEHSLWRKLSPRSIKRRLTIGESHRLAGWSISPITRVQYIFTGSSWLLKISGILLLSLVVLNPILVSGISQDQGTSINTVTQAANGSRWNGWLDDSNRRYNGGEFRDTPGIVAFTVSFSNLSAPAAPICSTSSNSNCSASALVSSIQASCTPVRTSNPANIGTQTSRQQTSQSFCSVIDPTLCTSLVTGSPSTVVNFTSGEAPACKTVDQPCLGEFAIIFGAYVLFPASGADTNHDINTVDCTLSIGNVTVVQNGQSTPTLDRNSFVKSEYSSTTYGEIVPLRRIYTESPRESSPFAFTGSETPDGANNLFNTAVGTLLLGALVDADAFAVASRIESAFEMATLFSFSRSPSSSDVDFTYQIANELIYVYDKKVLLILLAPLLATLLGCWGRWWIGGREVIGYDVVEIARMGPVGGLEGKVAEDMNEIENKKVWAVNTGEGKKLLASN